MTSSLPHLAAAIRVAGAIHWSVAPGWLRGFTALSLIGYFSGNRLLLGYQTC